MKHRYKTIAFLFFLSLGLGACNKPLLYGSNQPSAEVTQNFNVPPREAFRAAKEALLFRGYSLKDVDEEKLTLETYWQPSTADSHYVEVFGEKDYGTVGSYYRLVVHVTPRGNGSKVSIMNIAKSFISNIRSSNREEDELLKKIADFTRKRNIEVTNIGLQ